MDKKGKVTVGNFLLFLVGFFIAFLNIILRLKKLPNGMYDINAYLNSIMSSDFWIITGVAIIICVIAIIWREYF